MGPFCNREIGRILGGVEVRDLGDGEVNRSSVVFPGSRGRGVATRSSRPALDYAAWELGARRAVIEILYANEASVGVVRRLGAIADGAGLSDRGATVLVCRLGLESVDCL